MKLIVKADLTDQNEAKLVELRLNLEEFGVILRSLLVDYGVKDSRRITTHDAKIRKQLILDLGKVDALISCSQTT